MKAILVIDIDANELPEDAYANVYVFGKYGEQEDDFVACKGDVPLKPMPTKKKPLFDPDHCEIEKEIKIAHEIVGYNRCIDEIMGETE